MKLVFLILLLTLHLGCAANQPVICEEIGGSCQEECAANEAQYHSRTYCEWRSVCCVPESALQW